MRCRVATVAVLDHNTWTVPPRLNPSYREAYHLAVVSPDPLKVESPKLLVCVVSVPDSGSTAQALGQPHADDPL